MNNSRPNMQSNHAPQYMNTNKETTQSSQLIAQKMIAVMRDITAIGKDSRNQSQGFSFRGIDAVYNELHNLLAKHGIVTLPIAGEPITQERTNAKGTTLRFVQVPMTYEFVAEDGSSISCHVIGEGMDSGDKATNKAMAIAHKYALLQTFLIPTEEIKDPDYETHEVVTKPVRISKPEIKKIPDANKELPQTPVDLLVSMMTTDNITDDHVLHFLYAKKVITDRNIYIFDIPEKVVNRLIEKWDDVKAFKPAI